MNIFSIGWFDAAGLNTTFSRAWNKYGYGSWRTLFLRNDMDLPVDINPGDGWEKIKPIIDESDLIIVNPLLLDGDIESHLMDDWTNLNVMQQNGLPKFIFPYILNSNKPILFFINGSNNTRKWSILYREMFDIYGYYVACSTPDLMKHFPKAKYLPGFIDYEEDFWNLPRYKNIRNKFTISQFPSNPSIKNTDEFVKLAKELEHQLPILFSVTRGVTKTQSINLRRDVEFTFDHLQGYYGINSLESAVLGVINFVKLDDWCKKNFCEVAGTSDTPWVLVDNINDVKKELIDFIKYPESVAIKSSAIKEWIRTYWKVEKHLNRMRDYFETITTTNNNQRTK